MRNPVPELRGIGVSAGLAAGPAYRLTPAPTLPVPVAVSDPDAELERAVAALTAVAADLGRRADQAADPTAADILRAQVMMIDDPVLRDAVTDNVAAGSDAPHAIADALAAYRQAFEAAGGYLAERVADLDDLRDRAVAVCLGQPMPGVPAPGHPYVLLARDLAPADTAGLDPAQVLAVVTEAGGPTSHTAIVARSLGLPAVVRCAEVLAVTDGTIVRVDGATGQVSVGVDEATVAQTQHRERIRRAQLADSTGPGRTADGHPVALLANIGSARDLAGAPAAEGVGLFRTELLYLDRAVAPTLAEQIETYAEVFALAEGRRIVVRTLDSGADKPLPFLHHDHEPNPALGMRGLRLARRHPDVLRSQLRAIAEAAKATSADVWVMAPMVATVHEAREFAARCREVGLPRVGVMIEIPAAALQAASILAAVDFLSIGTNDLSQYAFAADRECGELADLLDPWQPALLALIAACGSAGAAAGKPVSVCGEAGADAALAPILVGLGVTSLSMSARALPAVRASLAGRSLADCRQLAKIALAAPDAAAAREAAAAFAP
jgi:phosphotransferase system enzyme I (PtsI)